MTKINIGRAHAVVSFGEIFRRLPACRDDVDLKNRAAYRNICNSPIRGHLIRSLLKESVNEFSPSLRDLGLSDLRRRYFEKSIFRGGVNERPRRSGPRDRSGM